MTLQALIKTLGDAIIPGEKGEASLWETLHILKDSPWANWYKQLTKVKYILCNIPNGAIWSNLFLYLLQTEKLL